MWIDRCLILKGKISDVLPVEIVKLLFLFKSLEAFIATNQIVLSDLK